MTERDLSSELLAVVEEFRRAWDALDFTALRALWDRELTCPVYVSEEADRIIGWNALDA